MALPSMMKLDEQLANLWSVVEQIFQSIVFGSFDIHFQQINCVMSQIGGNALQSADRERSAFVLEASWRGHGVRNMCRISRWIKTGETVFIPKPEVMEMEFFGQRLAANPVDGSRRGIKCVNRATKARNDSKIEGDILPDAEGIDDRA